MFFRILCSALMVLTFSFQVSAEPIPATVRNIWHKSEIPDSAVALYVQEVDAKAPLLSLNTTQAMTPASVMKLVSTVAALDTLGANYQWQTKVFADGVQQQDSLRGNLYIQGSGDPSLVIENLWLLLRQIRAKGIREIDGNLVLDRSAFADVNFDAAEFDQDPTRPYNAGANALLLNYDALSLIVTPAAMQAGAQPTVIPAIPVQITLDNHLQQVGGECGDWQHQMQALFSETATGLHVDLQGKFATACGEKVWQLYPYPVSQNAFFGAVFRQLWQEMGGRLNGNVLSGTVAPDARFITVWTSPALADVVRNMNKYSNNAMARQVYLTFGAEASQQAASLTHSQDALKSWLQQLDVHGDDAANAVSNENGSGLSRTDNLSAEMLGRILLKAYQAAYMPEFVSSLALLGQDGTVHKRLSQSDIAGQAHLKTGTMNGVKSLAGYIHTKSGHNYALVMIVNHKNAARAGAAQDALLQWLYENK